MSYQETLDAGEETDEICGWFLKAKKAKRRIWPGQKIFERRWFVLAGHRLHYYSDNKGDRDAKDPVDMNEFLWINTPSNNPRCVDKHGNRIGFDLVCRARILSLVPEEGAEELAKIIQGWKSKVQAGFLLKINKRGKFQKRWFMLYGYDLHYYEDPDDLKSRKEPVDLRDLIEIVRPSKNSHAKKFATFEIVNGKRRDSTCLDLVFEDKEYTFVAIEDDRASIELFKTIGKWKGKDDLILVKDNPVLTSEVKVTRVEQQGFGIIVTVVPAMKNSPKGWYGYRHPHLRVTVLPKGKDLSRSPAEKAGIRLGDAIVAVSGEGNISTVEKLAALVRGKAEVMFRVVRLPFKVNVEDAQWAKWCKEEEARRKAEELERLQCLAREKLKQQQHETALREINADPLVKKKRRNRKNRKKNAFGPQKHKDPSKSTDVIDLGSSEEDYDDYDTDDDAPPLPTAAGAAAAAGHDTGSDDDEWDVTMSPAPKIALNASFHI